jgi:hypothetical protein
MNVGNLSVQRSSRLYPQKEIVLVLISVRGWIELRIILRQEGLLQWKFPVTSTGIQTVTFRLVVQCVNHLRYGRINCTRGKEISCRLSKRNTHYRIRTGLLLPLVLVSTSASHNLTSYSFKIHINTIFPSRHISSMCCLCFRFTCTTIVGLFLICQRCHNLAHLVLDKTNLCLDRNVIG